MAAVYHPVVTLATKITRKHYLKFDIWILDFSVVVSFARAEHYCADARNYVRGLAKKAIFLFKSKAKKQKTNINQKEESS
ncbi:hypothetical protein A3I42_04465 [Candidatus Uhrbacteria bacterium RIFCSPLOWO2_02_FULL_49_11]|uniref:Uncharacterized protein n=1 Tax=Candidatus Uhrbacteria bacterium RIFCSPLOWO2_02_FULL_49_11 TaxID=1802409 RepID=A0A1F7VC30_9BACT|nr:MAG: hypothetical protein A3I42_04465 [Candidatus Uhrbacteria bacterium RIFCSPLOWO2_02_FULL_49_11]